MPQQQQQPTSSRQRRLAELMQIVGLTNALGGNPQDQQQLQQRDQQMRSAQAIQMMGLQQQAQEAQARQTLGQQQLEQTGAANAAQQEHYGNVLSQQERQGKQKLLADYVDRLMSNPQTTNAEIQPFAQQLGPEFATGFQQVGQVRTQKGVRTMQPLINDALQLPANQADPKQMRAAMDQFQLTNPDAFNAPEMPWGEMTGRMPTAPLQQPASAGMLAGREGGIASPVGQALQQYLGQTFPNAQLRQQNQQLNEADPLNPLNWLFGKKVRTQ